MERSGQTLQQYNCYICDAVFNVKDSLQKHVKRTHGVKNSAENVLYDKTLGINSEDDKALPESVRENLTAVKRETDFQGEEELNCLNSLDCEKCQKTFDSVHKLIYHKGEHYQFAI